MQTGCHWGTDYCIIFTPLFVSKDLNKLNTPSFEGVLHIKIVVRLFCLPLNPFFLLFYTRAGISRADPALNQRVVNSYFRYWYYVRMKWDTLILVITINDG